MVSHLQLHVPLVGALESVLELSDGSGTRHAMPFDVPQTVVVAVGGPNEIDMALGADRVGRVGTTVGEDDNLGECRNSITRRAGARSFSADFHTHSTRIGVVEIKVVDRSRRPDIGGTQRRDGTHASTPRVERAHSLASTRTVDIIVGGSSLLVGGEHIHNPSKAARHQETQEEAHGSWHRKSLTCCDEKHDNTPGAIISL